MKPVQSRCATLASRRLVDGPITRIVSRLKLVHTGQEIALFRPVEE